MPTHIFLLKIKIKLLFSPPSLSPLPLSLSPKAETHLSCYQKKKKPSIYFSLLLSLLFSILICIFSLSLYPLSNSINQAILIFFCLSKLSNSHNDSQRFVKKVVQIRSNSGHASSQYPCRRLCGLFRSRNCSQISTLLIPDANESHPQKPPNQ